MQDKLLLDGKVLTISDVSRVAAGKCRVEISDEAMIILKETRKLVFQLSDAGVPIYGCNRGVGWNKDIKVTKEFVRQYNRNVIYSHLVGIGEPAPVPVARAAMLIRLNMLLRGATGLSPEIAEGIRDFLNHDITPVMPETGSVGEADIGTLSYLALCLIGDGTVIWQGLEVPTRTALQEEGLLPLTFLEKDSLAVMSSNALAAGRAVLALKEMKQLLDTADIIACMALEGLNGNLSPLRAGVQAMKPYPNQNRTAERMREILAGSYLETSDPGRPLQDPLSFRCVSQVHGAVRDAMDYAEKSLEIYMNSSDDNPCLLPEEGDISSCGNFDPLTWVLPMQNLTIALAHVSEMSTRRMIKLADPAFTKLSRHLTPGEDVIAFSTLQKVFASLDAEVRFLAQPSSLDMLNLAGGMEDICTNAPLIVQKLDRMLGLVYSILAVEAIHCMQAMDLRRQHYASGTTEAYVRMRKIVSFYEADDRSISVDIEKLARFLREGGLSGSGAHEAGKD